MKNYIKQIFNSRSVNKMMSEQSFKKALKDIREFESCRSCVYSKPDSTGEFVYCVRHQHLMDKMDGCKSFKINTNCRY